VIDLERTDDGRGTFIFEDRPDKTQWVRNYYSGNLQGSLKLFSSVWADLKALGVEMEMENQNGSKKR